MIRFIDELYTSDKLKLKQGDIKWSVACGKGIAGVYFITLALCEHDLFDIYPAPVFKQRGIRRGNLTVVGLADSMESAEELVAKMIGEGMTANGSLSNMREYFNNFADKRL